MLNTGSNTDYASKMPDLAANANIQEALQTYHYGTIDPTTANSASFAAPSGFTDPAYGMVGKLKWIKTEIDTIKAAGASGGIFNSIIDAKGDLIVGTADNTPAKMSTGANGYVLKVDSSNLTYGVSWSNPDDTHLNLSGGTLVGNINISKASGDALIGLQAVSGSTKGLNLKTGSSMRWEILSNSTAESSTATGSDLVVKRYDNSGVLLGTVMTVTRSSGNINFEANVTVGGTLTVSGSSVEAVEIGYLNGVTSAIQTQLDAKAPSAGPTFTGTVVLPSTTSIGTVSNTEIGYLDGVTSAIQTQIGSKVGLSGNESIAGIKTFSNTTDASNSTTGGTVVSGGLAVAKKLYVGNNINGSGNATFAGVVSAASVTTDDVTAGVIWTTGGIDADGTIVSKGSVFVERVGTQSYSYNVEATMQFGTLTYNLKGDYNSSDYYYTVPANGLYIVQGSVSHSSVGTLTGTVYLKDSAGTIYAFGALGNFFGTSTGSYSATMYLSSGTKLKQTLIMTTNTTAKGFTGNLLIARVG
jgi:hypothetical protein